MTTLPITSNEAKTAENALLTRHFGSATSNGANAFKEIMQLIVGLKIPKDVVLELFKGAFGPNSPYEQCFVEVITAARLAKTEAEYLRMLNPTVI